ncbi:class I SAM-dependent methyltransferase [Pengzhenrongella frigida]|uniref:Class I SAM-dependent methyltransferase n=1 Tax=Pengzhenrongella frigida TaxID=1259133 RepID=A0A4Q5MWH5_9MICO|nr:class I SAM-dependent methyltransferase [Cellulomonas sp. HLT2-17]
MGDRERDKRLRQYWDKQADTYDRRTTWAERRLFAGTRPWLCRRATGDTLEVAIGTGLNLEHYPIGLSLTGIEWSPAMLAVARARAHRLHREVTLRDGDARDLPFRAAQFDTVVSTFALCSIPDADQALAEMARVLRPGGLLLLADHVESSVLPVRVLQRLVDVVTVPTQGERYCHRPLRAVLAMGFALEAHERLHLGVVERIAARRPAI